MAVALRVGLRQRPLEKKGKDGRVRGQPVPSLVPMRELTAAKPWHFSPPVLRFSAETDSLLERNGFELPVPRENGYRSESSGFVYPPKIVRVSSTDPPTSATE